MRRNVDINGLGPEVADVSMEPPVEGVSAAEQMSRKDALLGKVRVNEGDAWFVLLLSIG